MQCPRCGGWHYGMGTPPPVNYTTPSPKATEASDILRGAMDTIHAQSQKDPYDRDPSPDGDGVRWNGRVYGTDEQGSDVTVAFGREGSTREGHTMISNDHVSGWTFYGPDESGVKSHDHVGPGPEKDQLRDKYTGWDNFHDPS